MKCSNCGERGKLIGNSNIGTERYQCPSCYKIWYRRDKVKKKSVKKNKKSLFGKVNTSVGDNWLKKFKNRKIKV